MKLLIFLIVVTLFAGCKKDNPALARDKFVGNWYGLQVKNIKLNGVDADTVKETIPVMEKIDPGIDANQILFSKGLTNETKATVSDSTFIIPEQSQINLFDEELYFSTIIGQGILNRDGILSITTKCIAIQEKDTIEWNFTKTLRLK